MLKILVVDGFHTDKTFPIRLRLNLSRALRDKPLLDGIMNLGKPHDRSANAATDQSKRRLFRNTRKREIRRHDMFFGCNLARAVNPPIPVATIKGRSEPASTDPNASMARLSISQFSWNFE